MLIRAAGADLILVPLPEGPIYHNVETPTGRVQTCIQTGSPLRPPPVPDSWLAAPAWELAPVAGEIGEDWAALLPDDAYVASPGRASSGRSSPADGSLDAAPCHPPSSPGPTSWVSAIATSTRRPGSPS